MLIENYTKLYPPGIDFITVKYHNVKMINIIKSVGWLGI